MHPDRVWEEVASTLSLSFVAGGGSVSPLISGQLRGNEVSVTRVSTLAGEQGGLVTRLRVTYPEPLGLGLRLTRENLLHVLKKLTRARDIEVGDSGFDQAVHVQGRWPGRIRTFLTPARRLRIQRLLMSCEGCVIGDAYISVEQPGVMKDAFKMASLLRRMAHLAWFLTGDRKQQDRPLARAMQARREGRLAEAIQVLQAAPDSPAEEPSPARPLEELALEGELLLLGEERGHAAEVLAQAREEAPEDPEILEWVERAAAEPPPPATTRTENEGLALDRVAVCEDLFAGGLASAAIGQRYEERYHQQSVFWQGTLKRAERFSYDVLFGRTPGTRAVLELHEVPAGLYGTRTVQAVLQLPESALELLEDRRGAQLSFEGTLVKCDAFMRNLYLADGQLL